MAWFNNLFYYTNMGKIQLTRIRSVYADFKGMQNSKSFNDGSSLVGGNIVDAFNQNIEELNVVSNTDYSKYKVPDSDRYIDKFDPDYSKREYYSEMAKTNLDRIVSRLEMEYGFGENVKSEQQHIVIINKNENQISLVIDYTINDLIVQTNNEEEKKKLSELKEELDKPNKNWEIIKQSLLWILNFSKDLFLKVLPIILEKYKTN